jgi:hypothetical protein
MRRRLLKQLPQLTKFYEGMKPWDWDRMTLREVHEYVRQMNDFIAEQEKARS